MSRTVNKTYNKESPLLFYPRLEIPLTTPRIFHDTVVLDNQPIHFCIYARFLEAPDEAVELGYIDTGIAITNPDAPPLLKPLFRCRRNIISIPDLALTFAPPAPAAPPLRPEIFPANGQVRSVAAPSSTDIPAYKSGALVPGGVTDVSPARLCRLCRVRITGAELTITAIAAGDARATGSARVRQYAVIVIDAADGTELAVSYRYVTERGAETAAGLVRVHPGMAMREIYKALAPGGSAIVWAVGQIGRVRVCGERTIGESLEALVCGWEMGEIRWNDLHFEVTKYPDPPSLSTAALK